MQIFTETCSGIYLFRLTNVCWKSPHPRLGRARTRASFCLRGRAVVVACNSLTSLGAWGPGLPPIDRLGRARALPFANIISNLNVKIEFQSKLCLHILDVGSGGVHCCARIHRPTWAVQFSN
jgi:hypothetical protein